MPSTENTTLDRIQREIQDVVEREKELRKFYSKNNNNNNNNEVKMNGDINENGSDRPPLSRAQSVSALFNGEASTNTNGFRRFAPNPNSRGVMQKFFKARGKLSNVSSIINKKTTNFVIPEFKPSQVVIEPGKRIRNGFIPIEERMKSEIQDSYNREVELRQERRKSQIDLSILDYDLVDSHKNTNGLNGLRAAKSMAQLYDSNENLEEETVSAPSSFLKPAKSLADLCDAADEDVQPPGSLSLVMHFENIIKKNQQART